MLVKSQQWGVDPGQVESEWDWFWRPRPAFAAPLWNDGLDVSAKGRGALTGSAVWGAGPRGQALDNTAGGTLEFASSTLYAIPVTDPNMTIFVAYELASLQGSNPSPIAFRGSFASGMWELYKSGSKTFFSFHNGSLIDVQLANVTFPTSVGYHSMALVRKKGGAYEFYIDGVLEGTDTKADTFTSAAHTLLIGDLGSGLNNQVRGKYYIAAVWYNVAHTAARIKALHDDPGGPFRRLDEVPLFVPAAGEFATFNQTIAATAIISPSIIEVIIFGQAVSPTVVGSVALSRISTFSRTIPATAAVSPSLATAITFGKTISATALGAVSMVRGMFRTISATAVGSAVLTPVQLILKTISATAVTVVTVSQEIVLGVSISATAIGVASTIKKISKTIAATALAVASHTKGMFVTIGALAVGAPSTLKGVSKSISATALGQALVGTVQTVRTSISAAAVGLVSLVAASKFSGAISATVSAIASAATLFIDGGGGGPALIKRVKRAVRARLNRFMSG